MLRKSLSIIHYFNGRPLIGDGGGPTHPLTDDSGVWIQKQKPSRAFARAPSARAQNVYNENDKQGVLLFVVWPDRPQKIFARALRARAFVRYTAPTLSLLADAVECPADGPASCSFFSHMECGTPPRASREAEVQRRALQEASSSLEFYGVFVVWPDRPKIFFARALRARAFVR